MGILDFLAAIIPTLAWPFVALIVSLLFRKPLYHFLVLLPTMRVRYKGFEIFLDDHHDSPTPPAATLSEPPASPPTSRTAAPPKTPR